MGRKKNQNFQGIVYSTHPDNIRQEEVPEQERLAPASQKLKIVLDKKGRGGKTVTLVSNFKGPDQELTELGKRLKIKCGTGGNVKDGEIIIQGDCLEKITLLLQDWGYGMK